MSNCADLNLSFVIKSFTSFHFFKVFFVSSGRLFAFRVRSFKASPSDAFTNAQAHAERQEHGYAIPQHTGYQSRKHRRYHHVVRSAENDQAALPPGQNNADDFGSLQRYHA